MYVSSLWSIINKTAFLTNNQIGIRTFSRNKVTGLISLGISKLISAVFKTAESKLENKLLWGLFVSPLYSLVAYPSAMCI